MRDDEKNIRLTCCKKAVGFCFGTVNEDAEFSSARLSAVVRFWGVRKGGCSLPTYCCSDRKNIFRKETMFSSLVNNG
jgi:hypothetical protein